MVHGPKAQLSALPSVDRLIRWPEAQALVAAHGAVLVTQEARALLVQWREQIKAQLAHENPGAGAGSPHSAAMPSVPSVPNEAQLMQALQARCHARLRPRLQRVINLTGTVIHTNLGRAVLAPAALAHLAELMQGPNNLEYDLDAGGRGDRDSVVEGLLCEITGAEAATVVNNNAAAVLLTLAALAGGKEAIVSRGEQVEIGGAFRMPDVMASAGARMVEVGTTNRTHLSDYQRAITPQTSVLMKVHTSNYAVQGFTASVCEAELAPLARAHGIDLVTDLGSGSLIDLSAHGLPNEPTPQAMLAAGCDVVTFSGDKLLGGPQAGLIVGRKAAIERIRRFPMKRALRISKLPLAALEATLLLYLQPEHLPQTLPTLRWLTRGLAHIEATAQQLAPAMAAALAPGYTVTVVHLSSQIGSGSLPIDRLPSAGLAIAPSASRGKGRALEVLSVALRGLPTPLIGRVERDQLLLDLRCLDDASDVLAQLPHLSHALQVSVPQESGESAPRSRS